MKKQKNKQAIKASKLAKAKNMQNKIITVKNAEGEPDTKAEILIQNKINYTPKVSVIIPVYNVEEYLRECLDSVVNQTLKEIEIICVDDGSTDNSLEILKEYAKKDSRISVFAQSHIGTGKCRNIALSVVKGYYIGFADPDDWIENEYFEKLYKETIENPVDIVFQTKRIEFNTITQKQVVISTLKGKNDVEFRYNIIRQSAHLWSKIFNRKFIEKYNLRNAYTQRAQDLLFTVPAILLANDIKCIENAKYFYRKGHKSACQAEYTEEDFLNSIRLFQDIKDKLSQCGSNAQSLVQLKENLFYKNNLNKLSEIAQQNISKILEKKDFIDFELNNYKTKICIKNPAPDSIDKLWWGDYWLGLDLASGLREKNYDIRVDYHELFEFEENEDINIVIRGLHPCNGLNRTKLNIMYMISCRNKITQQELNQYDIIIVGSLKYQQKLCKKQKHTYYLPQFTNIKRFYPEKNEKYKNQILYVGNAYAGMRPAVQFAVSNDIPISVYGKFWEDKIDNKLIKGQYIDNNELHKYYSNADIVLNDTQVMMKENGFISNRIYDVTACKGFLISDYLPEIEEVYGNSIPMYRNAEEFKNLINYYLAHPKERIAKAEKAYNITINNYTSSIFARKLNTLIEKDKNKLKKMVLLKAIKNKCSMIKLPKLAYNIDSGEYYKLPKKSKIKPWLLLPYNLLKQKYLQEKYQNAQSQAICHQLKSLRIDIKNFGKADNDIDITTTAKTSAPAWFVNEQGRGRVVESVHKKETLTLKCHGTGKLRLDFRVADKRCNGTRFPLWVDYKSIKINGKEQLSSPVQTWHDKPYRFEMPVKDGQLINIEVAQQYHQYTKDELKDVILKLNPNSDYIRQNIKRLTDKIYNKITVTPSAPLAKKPKAASNQELLASISALNTRIERLEQENRAQQAQILAAIKALGKQ